MGKLYYLAYDLQMSFSRHAPMDRFLLQQFSDAEVLII